MRNTANYVFVDKPDGVVKAQKLKHAVKGRYRVLMQNQHTVVIHLKELNEKKKAERVARSPRPASVQPTPSDLASAMNVRKKSFEKILWLLHVILDHYFKHDGQLEYLLNWGSNYKTTWEPRNNMPEEAFSKYFACM